jgi:vitamin B12 transporter
MFMPLATIAVILSASPAPSSPPIVPSPTPSPALKTIGNVVSTSERRDTPLSETVKPTFVVDRTSIENNGYNTIGEALVNVPGERIFQYGAFGAEADYSAMGTTPGSGGTQLLLNGVPISAGSTGAIDLGTLSTNGVERIEVVESGGSTLYGSGASGGIINIITSVPRETYLNLAYGSFGDRAIRLATGNGVVGVTFERHVATNDYAYGPLDGFPGGVRQNDEALQTDASIEYRQKLGPYTIRASERSTQLDLGQPGELNNLTPENYNATNRDDLMTEISRTNGNRTASATLTGMRQGGLFFGGYGVSGPQVSSLIDARAGISLKEVVAEHGHDALVTGIDLWRESALDTLGPFGPPPNFAAAQSQSAVYAQQTIGIGPDGKTYAGLRAEHDSPAGSILSPGAGFLLPLGGARVGANVGTSFIVPTLFDLYFPGYANPNLLPERDRNFDSSITLPKLPIAPTMTVFDRVADNLITFNSKFVPLNAGTAHFQGATFSLKTRPLNRVTTTLSFTDLWIATQIVSGATTRADYEPVLSTTLNVERDMSTRGAGFGLAVHIVGPHTESSAGPGDFGGYTTADFYTKFRLPRHGFLTAHVKNLANEQYGSYYAFPQPGRSYRVEWATR